VIPQIVLITHIQVYTVSGQKVDL